MIEREEESIGRGDERRGKGTEEDRRGTEGMGGWEEEEESIV